MILSAESVYKSFPSSPLPLEVLRGVSLSVEPGDSIAIVGRSGSGKSTFLSLLAGLDIPTRGRIAVENREWNEMSETEASQVRAETIGLIFQQFHLLPHLTARENITLPLELLKKSNQSAQKIDQLLQSTGLSQRSHHYPSEMSRGECQRVAIARSLILEPKVLLADEPTASLDDETSQSIGNLLFDLPIQRGAAIVIATHDIDLARRCKKIFRITHGRLTEARDL